MVESKKKRKAVSVPMFVLGGPRGSSASSGSCQACVTMVTLRRWADVGLRAVCVQAEISLRRPSTFARLTQSQAISQSIAFSSLWDQWKIQLGAVKLVLCCHWMNVIQVHLMRSENQFHCTKLYAQISLFLILDQSLSVPTKPQHSQCEWTWPRSNTSLRRVLGDPIVKCMTWISVSFLDLAEGVEFFLNDWLWADAKNSIGHFFFQVQNFYFHRHSRHSNIKVEIKTKSREEKKANKQTQKLRLNKEIRRKKIYIHV